MVFLAVWFVGLLYLFDLPVRAVPSAASVSIIALARIGIFALPFGIASAIWITRNWKSSVIPEIPGRLLAKAFLAYVVADNLLLWGFHTETGESLNTLATTFLAQFTAVVLLLPSWKIPARWHEALAGLGTATLVLTILSIGVLIFPVDLSFKAQYAFSAPDLIEVILGVIAIPFLEEVIFRMGVIGFLHKRAGTFFSVVLSASFFAALHGDEIIWARLIGGLAMGWLYVRTGSIISSFMLHAIINGGIIIAPILWNVR